MRTGCLDDADLLRAVARAASLDDRRNGAKLAPTAADQVTGRLAQWCEHAAGGDERAFTAYLGEARLTRRHAEALMSDVAAPAAAAEVPSWAHTLADIAARASAGGDAGDPAVVPFGHLWTAAAGAARQAVVSRLDANQRGMLRPEVLDQLTGCFLADVARLGSRAVYQAFAQFRRRLDEDGEAGNAYEQFVNDQRAAGLPVLIRRYPVLGRLVAQRVGELAGATAELLARLEADRAALADAFWPAGDPGRVSAIRFGMGDRHGHGRTVAHVGFEHGLVLAYKPRPVAAERSLHRLLACLDEAGLAGPLAPAVVEREGYGWAAWISRRECADEAELASYYRRAGATLALGWLLGSRDLHAENIVAAGLAPAIIDAEMTSPPSLIPALRAVLGRLPAEAEVAARLQDSVIATGLLPAWMATRSGAAYDLSGLTGSHPGGELAWANLNTADMVPVEEPLPQARTENAPTRDTALAVTADRLSDLIGGYEAADRWLGRHKGLVADLVAASGLFDAPARITLRPTQVYGSLLAYAGRADMLGDGLTRSLALDAVSYRAWWPPALANLHASDPAAARRITAAERRVLERGDIPLFLAPPADQDLATECGPVTGVFTGAPAVELLNRLNRVGDAHRHEQVRYARGSFEGHRRASPRRATPPGYSRRPAARALDSAARHLASRISDSAVRVDGTVSWPLVEGDGSAIPPGLAPIGNDLYDGRAGLGVFLAAGAVHWGDDELAELARECVLPVAGTVRSAGIADLGGALSGTASAVYGLALTAALLGDAALTEDARRAAAHLAAQTADPAEFGPRPECGAGDVSGGLAGAALALCAAARHGAGEPAVTAAVQIATRALAEDLTRPVLTGAVGGDDAGLRAGIAHGVSGTALALHRVSIAASEDCFTSAAAAVLDAADAALVCADTAGRQLTAQWCRGTAGVAVAAIAMGRRRDSPSWTRGIGQAIMAGRRPGWLYDACVCCGRGGEIELLSMAGEQKAAQSLAMTVLPAPGQEWALGRWPGIVELVPGFHRGIAGLGYTFLRVLSPDRFPSVLAWE